MLSSFANFEIAFCSESVMFRLIFRLVYEGYLQCYEQNNLTGLLFLEVGQNYFYFVQETHRHHRRRQNTPLNGHCV